MILVIFPAICVTAFIVWSVTWWICAEIDERRWRNKGKK